MDQTDPFKMAVSDASRDTTWTQKIHDGWLNKWFMDYKGDGIYNTLPWSWQLWGGYTDFYDSVGNTFTEIIPQKYEFVYRGDNYVVMTWKGNYIGMGAGAEIEFFKELLPKDALYKGSPQFWAEAADKPLMALNLFAKGTTTQGPTQITSFAPGAPQTWVGSYNSNFQNPSVDSLSVDYSVTFPSKEMYDAFHNGRGGQVPGWTFHPGENTATRRNRRKQMGAR